MYSPSQNNEGLYGLTAVFGCPEKFLADENAECLLHWHPPVTWVLLNAEGDFCVSHFI